MKKFHSESTANTEMNFQLPKGSWGGIVLVYRGTNPAGVTHTRVDMGRVQLNVSNKPIVDCQADLLCYLTNLKGGVETFASAIGGAFYAMLYIPFGKPRDPNNVYYFSEQQRGLLKLQFPLIVDLVGGVIDVYLIPKDGIQNYWYCITSRYVVGGGAGSLSDVAVVPNISEVFLVTPTMIDQIRLAKDGQSILDGDVPAIQALSDWNNQIETTNTLLEISMNPSADLSEVISNELQYTYNFTGAGTLQQYFGYIVFTQSEAIRSAVVLKQAQTNRTVVTKQPMPMVNPAGLGSLSTLNKAGNSNLLQTTD